MYCVGLTGTIASGKSTLSHFFKEQGIVVISADVVARELTAAQQPALDAISKHFGKSIILSTGELNRKKLRKLIFADPSQKKWLEQLLHPLIRKQIELQIKKAQSAYVLIEIPLLTDRSDYPYLNRVLLVLADQEEQIKRVMQRDKVDRNHALAILASQPDKKTHQKIADDILYNQKSLEDMLSHAKILHQQYLQFAKLGS